MSPRRYWESRLYWLTIYYINVISILVWILGYPLMEGEDDELCVIV